jgi:MFS transporter, ACS family, tartrate transporter
MLTDRPEDAEWLSRDEKQWLTDRLAEERRARASVSEHSVAKALASGKVWWLALLYFFAISAYLGPIFFGPLIVADALKIGSMQVGWVMGAIGLAGVAGMLINGPLSDRKQERIGHAVVPMIVGAIGFAVSAMAGGGAMVVAGLALISFAVTAFLPVFWCLPAALLSGTAAAGGIALINSIGNFGGFFAPNIVGIGKSMTGTYSGSLWILAGFCVLSALMILPIARAPALRRHVK